MLQSRPCFDRAFLACAALGSLLACHGASSTGSTTLMQADGSASPSASPGDPLASWRDGPTKSAILQFIADVTDPKSPKYVPIADRIAAFDNDGTLWVEKPFPPEQSFEFDRVRSLAAEHPAWQREQPFQAALARDEARLARMSQSEEISLIDATHTGMTVPAFRAIARSWLDTWTDPHFGKHATDLVYQPMLDLLADLRKNGFQEYLCSGDTVEFLRSFAMQSYGISETHVAGTAVLTQIDADPRHPSLILVPGIVPPYNTYSGKPINLQRLVGRLPIFVAGNEDADMPLLALSTAGDGPRLALLVHHDDAEREFAYDRGAERALREARERGWIVVSMQRDFGTMFPPRR